MNSIVTDYYPVFEMYQAPRAQLMLLLKDQDLAFQPSSQNETLGELCLDIGQTQHAYIESFKTFKMSFEPKANGPELTVDNLRGWYNELDAELRRVVTGLSEADIQSRKVYRGDNFELLPNIQLDVYKEALLIFYGKVSVYLKGLGIPLPEQWQEWIG